MKRSPKTIDTRPGMVARMEAAAIWAGGASDWEHHRDVALARFVLVDALTANGDLAGHWRGGDG